MTRNNAPEPAHRGMKLAISELKVGMVVCDLDRPWLETPFATQGFTVSRAEDIATIGRYCQHVYVDIDRNGRPYRATEVGVDTVALGDSPFQTPRHLRQAQQAHGEARAITLSFMDEVRLGRNLDMQAVKATVGDCVRAIMVNPDAMGWVTRIRSQDVYTSEHSLNVGLLAITFGHHLGADEEELNRLGMAGILHDVGKTQTPLTVLNKEGALEGEELEVMRRHPRDGRDILIAHASAARSAVDVAYNHHEALDGSGYPRKLKATSISQLTRIITLCDVYDAITSDRIYKKGASSLEAMRILYSLRGKKFDDELTEHFIQCFGIYPPGSLVELESGEIAIVICRNPRHRHLPRVLLVRDAAGQPCPERVVDLERVAGSEKHPIRASLPNGSRGVRLEVYIERGLRLA